MGEFRKRKWPRLAAWAIILGTICSIAAILISGTSLFKTWEFKTYDLRMRLLQPYRPKPQGVVMFYVDDPSLRHMEAQGIHWPWPREMQASALDFCRRGGAKAVFFDIFFSEDSVYGVDDDAAFADGVAKGPPSYFVFFLSKDEPADDERIRTLIQKSGIPLSAPYPDWIQSERSMISLPIGPLVNAARGFGNAQMPPDDDGTYRRIPLMEKLGDAIIPSMPLKIASDVSKALKLSWPERTRFNFADQTIPLDDDGRMMLNYYGKTDTFKGYSLAEVLVSDAAVAAGQKPGIDPSIVKDKVVIVGIAAPGLYDLKPTPLSRVYPGAEIHATAIENIMTGDFITPLSQKTSAAIVFSFGILAALGLAWISASWGMVLWIAFLSAAVVGGGTFFFARGIWMPAVPPALALLASSFTMIFRNYMTEGRKKREIRHAFGQYLSPEVVSEIAKNPEGLSLGGAVSEVTLFFSDIADFTTMSEKTPPTELVGQLNEYFSLTTKIIQGHGGTLDKYIGDAIMAFWGAPLANDKQQARAVMAALDIQKALASGSRFSTRIGIHTGEAVVGNIGSDVRFNYTAIGDTVNLASRLEGLNKRYGTNIIISETTYKAAKDVMEARRLSLVRVKGRKEPIGIYEPLGRKGDFGKLTPEACEMFAAARGLFEKGRFAEAKEAFAEIGTKFDDVASRYYQLICDQYIRKPPPEFDGVTTFTAK